MNLDELRSGLTTLADEMEPFEGNVRALHRRERRRRVGMASIAAVAVVAIAMATVAIARSGDSGKIHVAGVPGKEVSPVEITHIDAIVVPASPAVKAALDASPLVARYAFVAAKDRTSGQVPSIEASQQALCALQTRDGYAVEATAFGTDIRPGLTASLAGKATVYDAPGGFGYDAEVFMKAGASAADTNAVRSALQSDPAVADFQFVSTTDAYAIFKRDFADQPALVESTKPSDLPASFRILLETGRSETAFEAPYRHARGVDTIISGNARQIFRPGDEASFGISPCARQP
jgi:FtsX extracellular domain